MTEYARVRCVEAWSTRAPWAKDCVCHLRLGELVECGTNILYPDANILLRLGNLWL